MVYEPREDSWLLERVVRERARGRVIDVGCGTGILARAAGDALAVDIDPQAVEHARSTGVDAHVSDLFSEVSGTFDTIISNTPYLPSDPRAPDVALDGGTKGYEWILRFLEQAKKHLARDGHILFLISTQTNPSVIEQWLTKNCFVYDICARERVFFEELLVYDARFALPDIQEATYLASGKRSKVYRHGNHVIKLAQTRRIEQEAHMLQAVNKLGLGPKYYAHTPHRLIMEYIAGERIDTFLAQGGDSKRVFAEVLRQCRLLDEAHINKKEMTNPYKHILISDERVVMIDWERAKKTTRPQNVAQFREYIKKHTSLAERVYAVVKRIPEGRVATYKEIGRRINSNAYQAIGQALKRNPDPNSIPCHRVIRSDRTLGGYFGGEQAKKKRLLKDEGVLFDVQGRVRKECLLTQST